MLHAFFPSSLGKQMKCAESAERGYYHVINKLICIALQMTAELNIFFQ